MSNFVGCDCAKKFEDTIDNKNDNNTNLPKMSLISKKSTKEEEENENLTFVKYNTINSQFFYWKNRR